MLPIGGTLRTGAPWALVPKSFQAGIGACGVPPQNLRGLLSLMGVSARSWGRPPLALGGAELSVSWA